MKNLTQILLASLVMLAVWSCKSDNNVAELKSEMVDDVPEMKYTLTPFEPSYEFADAHLQDVTYKDGTFDFSIGEGSYELGVQTPDVESRMCANSAKGQHIHLIIDNQPYAAKYTSNFEHKVEDGDHYMLAFLSRSYHESIKTENANLTKKITVKDSSIVSMEEVDRKMIFYSRPKGTYVGEDTKKVMLDFYLHNLTLSEKGYKVEADINGEKHMITKWQPYYIEGLPIGENTIILTLLDADGTKIDTPLNPVSRRFNLKEDAADKM